MKTTAIYFMKSPTGKIYIGQTRNLKVRLSKYKGGHCKAQPHLFNSLNKYGFEAHEFMVLQYLPADIDQTNLNNLEVFYITQYERAGYKMLNVKEGGTNGKLSQESIDKMRRNLVKTINTPEYKAKISKIRKGKGKNEENLKRLEEARKKRVYKKFDTAGIERMKEIRKRRIIVHSDETKRKIGLAHKGKTCPPVSDETRKKLSLINKGRKLPNETKYKISESHKESIGQYTLDGVLIKIWQSAKEACDLLGLHRGHMCNILKGNNKYKGYKWYKL